ncbi:glucosamine-6-phosphate deaminase [Pseudonocardia sp.]|jgi:glucosamine-6-phosphate deaminase|uniref:glucosamine-6-phosphate deaminase n=1 Tax=Pseudonocardia sp. TaxID=60912 RepID=UPI00260F7ADF|nr:glucosamine-6-phosphate deaminase [Pseudonocardia sp.]MCW2720440.1 Glucosamine-6-phosphate deaminase [Pseudonocardia sp.]MDT7617018.1 glucosamine-6-phosphate deaminase [Pseudonocardiales bacterium]
MEVLIHRSAEAGGRVVADVVEDVVRRGPTVLGLATGSSPLLAYAELIRRHREEGLSFARVEAFLLDEYVGLPAGHPESYREVIRRELTGHLDIDADRVHAPDGSHPDPPAAAAEYEKSLVGVGVQILGIGTNGHIGFNEPGSSLMSLTRVKTLARQTRDDNARFFGDSIDAVPRHVITQGLGTIARAGHLVLTAAGEHKAAAVAAAVEGPLTASCPASILQWHPHVTVVLDDAAASRLERASFYREIAAQKPAWA